MVRLKQNDVGLFDMQGDVCEWCLDYHRGDYYKQSPEKDPSSGSDRVSRGGSWDFVFSRDSRSAFRFWDVAVYRDYVGGFRLVRELDDSSQIPPPPVPPTAPATESTTNTIGMKLNLIPSGSFLMGSPEGEEAFKGSSVMLADCQVGLHGRYSHKIRPESTYNYSLGLKGHGTFRFRVGVRGIDVKSGEQT